MIDFKSDTWEAIEEHSNKHIERASQALQQRGMSEADSEFYRGRIDALRDVLAMATVKPPRTGSLS